MSGMQGLTDPQRAAIRAAASRWDTWLREQVELECADLRRVGERLHAMTQDLR